MAGESVLERPADARSVDAASAGLAVEKHVGNFLGRIADALRVDTVAVLLLDETGEHLIAHAAKGLEEEVEQGLTLPLGKGFAGRVVAERRPIVIEDITDPEVVVLNPLLREKGLRSLLGVPLQVEDQVFGVLHVGSTAPRAFSSQDVALLELVAERVALPLAQSQLFEQERDARLEVDASRHQLAFLADASAVLSSSLDYERTLATVAQLAVPRLADWCVIDLLGDDEEVRRVAVACADPSKEPLAEELRRSYPSRPTQPEGTAKALRTGSSELALVTDEWLDAIATDTRQREILGTLGLRSNILVPLIARGTTLGVLTLATAESGRVYAEEDVRLAEELAARAALAVDNARLFREEQAARERLSYLAEASALLGSSLDYEQTLERIAEMAVPKLADWCAVDVADEQGSLRRVALAHADPEKVRWAEELSERYPPERESRRGVYEVFRTGQAELVPEIPDSMLVEVARDEEHLSLLREVGLHSYICAPMVARDRITGVLTLVRAESVRSYGELDIALVEDVARRAALAVDNARLFKEAVDNEEQMRFLAEAGAVLASSLDYAATLASVARLAVPVFADWCIVDVVEDEEIHRVATAASDEESESLLEELRRRYPPTMDSPQPAAAALRAGEPVIYHEFTPESLAKTVRDDYHLEIITRLSPRSAVAVPLVARGNTIGAMTFAWASSGRLYSDRDLVLAEEVARRAALAVENARLHRETEERAQAALALGHVGDGVFLLDRHGIVRLWNPAAEAITGLASHDVLGRAADDAIPGWREIGARVPVAAGPAFAQSAETVPLEAGERELWLSITGVALEDGAVYAFRDLTEERALEKIRSDFVSTVSHELRTPLASVYGAAMTLTRKDVELDKEQRASLLDVVAQEAERLARIVNDVLLASRLDSHNLAFTIESCDPVQAAEAAVAAAKTHLPEHLELQVAASAAPLVAADPEQLRQVLENLIDNAAKYTPEASVVEVGVGRRGRWACFWVRDEGIGIPERERERIFEKFYRLDPELLRGVGGTGLGLYIARELVQRMGGRIWIESEDGAGSTISFELPLADVDAHRY